MDVLELLLHSSHPKPGVDFGGGPAPSPRSSALARCNRLRTPAASQGPSSHQASVSPRSMVLGKHLLTGAVQGGCLCSAPLGDEPGTGMGTGTWLSAPWVPTCGWPRACKAGTSSAGKGRAGSLSQQGWHSTKSRLPAGPGDEATRHHSLARVEGTGCSRRAGTMGERVPFPRKSS